ncbi:MAG TPA: VCBS repeat-containing protein, partial [Acidimicrobiales bacterium]|nr:VCBS repeat-containing protein [Acidimicrobiales bacterium]
FALPFVVDTPSDLREVTLADVHEDGVPDLLATSWDGAAAPRSSVVSVALGDGGGGFADPVAYLAAPGLQGPSAPLGVADIDGYGRVDLYGAFANSPDVYVLPGHGDGSFGPPIVSPSGVRQVATVIAEDFDGDGHLDLVTKSTVVFGDGAGHFVEPHGIVGGGTVVTADIDGNGQPDVLAALGHRLNVLLNHLDGARDHD